MLLLDFYRIGCYNGIEKGIGFRPKAGQKGGVFMPNQKIAYRRLEEDLEKRILAGEYDKTGLLPTEKELEDEYDVSRTTVRRATELLEQKELIRRIQGHGTRVLRIPSNNTFKKFHNVTMINERVLLPDEISRAPLYPYINIDVYDEPRNTVCEFLGLPAGTPVYRVERTMNFEDYVVSYTLNYLSMDLVPGLDQYSGKFTNLYAFLEDKYGLKYDHGTDTIRAVSASLSIAKILEIEVGDPIMLVLRKAYHSGGPLEVAVTFFRADRFNLELVQQGSPTYFH